MRLAIVCLGMCLSVSLVEGSSFGIPLFNAPPKYPVGEEPHSICSADLDGDGDNDLAVANMEYDENNPTISILINNGDGTFQPAEGYLPKGTASSVRAADLDGDGDFDLAVANGNALVLLNNGDATFQDPVEYAFWGESNSICISDLDGDGDSDLVLSLGYHSTAGRDDVLVLLNKGDGTFNDGLKYPVGAYPLSVSASDLDGDGDNDLAVAHCFVPGGISVLFNNGDGTFGERVSCGPDDRRYRDVCAADFDGDGDSDLAAAHDRYWGSGDDGLSILLNNGDGTFMSPVAYGRYRFAYEMLASDIDGDGDSDIVLAGWYQSIAILLNSGDGTFQEELLYKSVGSARSVCASDLDADGDADLALANYWTDDVTVMINRDNGELLDLTSFSAGHISRTVYSSDIDGDGDNDLAIPSSSDDAVLVLLNDRGGSFSHRASYKSGHYPMAAVASDFDGDGDSDLATANHESDDISILLNEGEGTFSSAVAYGVGDGPYSMCSSDFDGDGYGDLAVVNNKSADVSICLSAGDGTFHGAVNYDVGSAPRSICAFDLEGDGDTDLAVSNLSSPGEGMWDVSILRNNGDGTFAAQVRHPFGHEPWGMCASDLDGDGDTDLAVMHSWPDLITILFNSGDGTFQNGGNYDVGSKPRYVCALDLDEDGDMDLAVANYESRDVSILRNKGNGTFEVPVKYPSRGEPWSIIASDLDGDGDDDVAIAGDSPDLVSVLLNLNDETPTTLESFATVRREDVIEIIWSLSEMGSGMDYQIYREEAGGAFLPVEIEIRREGELSYRGIDRTCRPGIPYRYRVDAVDCSMTRTLFETEVLTLSVPSLVLVQNVPNPFDPVATATTIRYYVPERMRVTLNVFDVLGRRVAELFDRVHEAGPHVITWDGYDDDGNALPSGVYFCELRSGTRSKSRKMLLIRSG